MNQNEQIALICGLIIIAVALVILQIRRKNEKAREYVRSTSARYQDIMKLNQEFHFYELQEEYCFCKPVNSKAQLDRFNFDTFLENKIDDDPNLFHEIIRRAEMNRKLLEDYQNKIDNDIAGLREETKFKNDIISYKKYRKYEKRLTEELVQKPITAPEIVCDADYTSPKGRNSYNKRRTYDLNQLIVHVLAVQKKREQKETKAYQRRMMTDSLRYDIMKRDGFHCVLCGRGAEDGVKLHVDHIVPVSKGGKTTPENLRTLCENCNFGKRDKYDVNGMN